MGQILPQLEIISLIGKGGMGAVYKDCQKTPGRMIALKIRLPRGDERRTYPQWSVRSEQRSAN